MTDVPSDPRLLMLASGDTVFVLRAAIEAGERVQVSGVDVTIAARIGMGHKLAAKPVRAGEKIIKYGAPIGSATQAIAVGAHVHLHNVKSDYTPTYSLPDDGKAEGVSTGVNA